MESGVEDGDVGHALEDFLARLNAAQVRRHVQGAELHEFLALGHDGFRHLDGVLEDLGAVEHAVPDGVDVVRVAEVGNHLFQGLGVVGRAARADALHQPLRQALFLLHVEKLVLQGARAGIDHEHFLDCLLHSLCRFLLLL